MMVVADEFVLERRFKVFSVYRLFSDNDRG